MTGTPLSRRAIRTAIFDLDGTLIDSEGNHYESDRILLSRRGIPFSREDKARYVGKDIVEMVRSVAAEYGLREGVNELLAEKNGIYRQLALRSSILFPPMKNLLEGLRDRGIPMCVATGSNSAIAAEILELLDIRHFFSFVISSSDVPRGKPSPDIFLEAARRMHGSPESTIVFEDTCYGVQAARSAGMACVAFPAAPVGKGDCCSQADYTVAGGPGDLDIEAFFLWFETAFPRGTVAGRAILPVAEK